MLLHCTSQMCGKSNSALRSTFLSALGDKAVQKWRLTSLRRDKSLLYIIILSCWDSFSSAFCSNFVSFRLALLTSKWATTKCYHAGVTIFYHLVSVSPALSVHQAEAFTNRKQLARKLSEVWPVDPMEKWTYEARWKFHFVCLYFAHFVNLILFKHFGWVFRITNKQKVILMVNVFQRMFEILCRQKIWFTI